MVDVRWPCRTALLGVRRPYHVAQSVAAPAREMKAVKTASHTGLLSVCVHDYLPEHWDLLPARLRRAPPSFRE